MRLKYSTLLSNLHDIDFKTYYLDPSYHKRFKTNEKFEVPAIFDACAKMIFLIRNVYKTCLYNLLKRNKANIIYNLILTLPI